MDELIPLTAHLGSRPPGDIEMVNSYTSPSAPVQGQMRQAGLDVWLLDHPHGYVQFLSQAFEGGDEPHLTRVNVSLLCVHATEQGAQSLSERTVAAVQGGWMSQTGWQIAERRVERDTRATFVFMTATIQLPTVLLPQIKEPT